MGRMLALPVAALALGLGPRLLVAQPAARPGPVIPAFGAVFDVPRVDFATPTDRAYRLVFEVALAPSDSTLRNANIETAARFLNMHVRAGVPRDSLHAALILHGPAARATLRNDAYRRRFGVDNPDQGLLEALHAAGVELILCGQSAMSRGFYPELLAPDVEVALSAMTALAVLQQEGYTFIPF